MKMLKHSDDRVKLINEILNGIRIISVYLKNANRIRVFQLGGKLYKNG